MQTNRPLKILFGSAHPYLPQMFGGAQSSNHELAQRLRDRGHEVAVLSGLTGDGWLGLRARVLLKLQNRNYVRDNGLGYPVYRAWFAQEAARRVAEEFKADCAVFQSRLPVELAQAIDRRKTRTFIYLRNVETVDLGGSLSDLTDTQFLANSHFTAQRFKETDGLTAHVIHPMIEPEKYRVSSTHSSVTFINPHPYKGVGIALDVAAECPEIPFTFVRGWGLTAKQEGDLQMRLAKLPNVTLRASTDDMRTVYNDAKIVLVPSQWEEAFGRVAAEAQISGIPVVASAIGGLPEAVGPGGVLLDRNAPIKRWADEIRALWHDDEAFRTVSQAALEYSKRDEMVPEKQVDRFLEVLRAS